MRPSVVKQSTLNRLKEMSIRGWFEKRRSKGHRELAGVSTPIGGLSWTRRHSDQEILQRLCTFLEARRALWIPFNYEDHDHVVDSMLATRDAMTRTLQDLTDESQAASVVRKMRLSIERFLNTPAHSDVLFYSSLGEVRGFIGACLAEVSSTYNLNIHPPLAWILPPEDEANIRPYNPRGEELRTIMIEPSEDRLPHDPGAGP